VTCHCDGLPRGVCGKCFHKEKTSVNERSRAARYKKPVVAVKKRGQSVVAHVSFQSTSSCNFSCVNSLNSCSLHAQTKEKGPGVARRQWAIEMNEARQLHLKTHGAIDRMDHLIRNCHMGHRTWKCWHAGMNHAKLKRWQSSLLLTFTRNAAQAV